MNKPRFSTEQSQELVTLALIAICVLFATGYILTYLPIIEFAQQLPHPPQPATTGLIIITALSFVATTIAGYRLKDSPSKRVIICIGSATFITTTMLVVSITSGSAPWYLLPILLLPTAVKTSKDKSRIKSKPEKP